MGSPPAAGGGPHPTTAAAAAAEVVRVAAAWRAVGEDRKEDVVVEVVVPERATEAVPSILRKPSTIFGCVF